MPYCLLSGYSIALFLIRTYHNTASISYSNILPHSRKPKLILFIASHKKSTYFLLNFVFKEL